MSGLKYEFKKKKKKFMTPTGEDNQYMCNMLIRREYRTHLLPTKQDNLHCKRYN